jgi:uncharacterized protein YutE (UPF0331/DUF86 family)
MSEQLALIRTKLRHLGRMAEYLGYSLEQVQHALEVKDWEALNPEQHESLAAFRVRFIEFQEHLGKAMRAVAMFEEQPVERFGTVLAFMERLRVLDSAERWHELRALRNAVNHEYEEDSARLRELFDLLQAGTPVLLGYYESLRQFCADAYP